MKMDITKENKFRKCDMKAKFSLLVAFCLLVVTATSCKDDGNKPELTQTGGDVPYKICPCEFDIEPITIQGEARFLIDTFYDWNYIVWYNDRDIDEAYLMLRPDDNSMPIKADICNFPDFAKNWHSENGIIVYYEGIMYNGWCENLTLGCRGFCSTMILTKLKRM